MKKNFLNKKIFNLLFFAGAIHTQSFPMTEPGCTENKPNKQGFLPQKIFAFRYITVINDTPKTLFLHYNRPDPGYLGAHKLILNRKEITSGSMHTLMIAIEEKNRSKCIICEQNDAADCINSIQATVSSDEAEILITQAESKPLRIITCSAPSPIPFQE